jgi:hypothetical protein
MKKTGGILMAEYALPTPGSAEGEDDLDLQSKEPLAAHTPGSAEGEDDDDEEDEVDAGR